LIDLFIDLFIYLSIEGIKRRQKTTD